MNEKERRCFQAEVRVAKADGKTRLIGYSAVFGRKSVDLGGFTEEIAPGAFSNTLRNDDVVAEFNHDDSLVLGRLSAKTLRLSEDDTGLLMEVDLPDTSVARDLAESVSRGDVKGQSFSFWTITDEWRTQDGLPHRVLKEVKLYDVGPATFPAYPDTNVAARALEARRLAEMKASESKKDATDRPRRHRHAMALSR